jgi:aryl-alcohol dehydrogenase-like predicted oxidoreductase
MEALTRAVDSGKTRYIGFSEWPAERIRAALDLTAASTSVGTGVTKFVSSQPQ